MALPTRLPRLGRATVSRVLTEARLVVFGPWASQPRAAWVDRRRSEEDTMNKKLIVAGVAGCALAAAIAAAAKKSSAGPKPEVWDKMRSKMEEMPADFPPRVMYDNVSATKANTDRILALLEERDG